jgi:hypothetical protein
MPQPSETLAVQIDRQIGRVVGEASYSATEYSLTYKMSRTVVDPSAKHRAGNVWRQTGRRVFVTAGFVTMTFDGLPFVFTELDAYANDARWEEQEIAMPISVATGALVLGESLNDDRISLAVEPSFEVDRKQKTIRISFERETGEWFEIGSGLFAGICEGRLTSLVLTTVGFP